MHNYQPAFAEGSGDLTTTYHPALSGPELIAELRALLSLERRAERLVCRYLADLADRIVERRDGMLSAYVDELHAARCFFRLGVRETRERVRVGRALRTLPHIEQAFIDGLLSYSRVREVTRVATTQNELRWLSLAQTLDMRTFERRVAGAQMLHLSAPGSDDAPAAPLASRQPRGAEPRGAEPRGAEPRGAEPRGAEPRGAEPRGATSLAGEPLLLGEALLGAEPMLGGETSLTGEPLLGGEAPLGAETSLRSKSLLGGETSLTGEPLFDGGAGLGAERGAIASPSWAARASNDVDFTDPRHVDPSVRSEWIGPNKVRVTFELSAEAWALVERALQGARRAGRAGLGEGEALESLARDALSAQTEAADAGEPQRPIVVHDRQSCGRSEIKTRAVELQTAGRAVELEPAPAAALVCGALEQDLERVDASEDDEPEATHLEVSVSGRPSTVLLLQVMGRRGGWTADALTASSGMSARDVSVALTLLELSGKVYNRAGLFEPR